MYNLFFGIGIICGILMFYHLCKKEEIPTKNVDSILILLVIALLAAFVSSALFDNLVHGRFKSDEGFFSGFTFYGGLLMSSFIIVIGCFIVFKDSLKVYRMLNILSVCLVLGHAFGRIGCFLGGCCYGLETNSIFGFVFPVYDINGLVVDHHKVLPTQLYESVFLFVLFVFLYRDLKNAFIKYLIGYGTFRFLLEFLRGDERGVLFTNILHPSQFVSMLLISTGIVLLILKKKNVILKNTSVPDLPP